MYRNNKLDPTQQKLFTQIKHDFFDLYQDLLRFQRFEKRFIEQRALVTFDLHNSPLLKEIESKTGRHTVNSPALAIHIDDLESYSEFAKQNPSYLKFGNAIYHGVNTLIDNPHHKGLEKTYAECAQFLMIPASDQQEADRIAKELYEQHCKELGLKPETIVRLKDVAQDEMGDSSAYIQSREEPELTWHASITVERAPVNGAGLFVKGKNEKEPSYYVPPYIIALHELGHVERIKLLQSPDKFPPTNINETAQVIDQIIYSDIIYKRIHGINLEAVVKYAKNFPSDAENGMSPGEVANHFRILKKKYGTIEQCLMSVEGRAFINRFYNNTVPIAHTDPSDKKKMI